MNARLNAAQALSGDLNAVQALSGDIGAGRVVVNDYQIQADAIDGGHRLTITRGSEVQTMDLMDGAPGAPGEPGKDAPQESVLYTAQSLTDEQQAQARENVGAASAERMEKVEAALPGKLTEPAEGLAVGKYFRVAAIDENGHAVLEAVDAKDVGVQDVQVAGASVVADGVANVPIATNVIPGVSRFSPDMGISQQPNGVAYITMARNANINNRSKYLPVTPAFIDYAVKAAMCDGKGAAWTADEQAAARERMGIPGDFELIEEIICDGNASAYTRSVEPDGIPYRFISVFIELEIQAGNTYPNTFFRAYDGNDNAVLYDGKQAQSKGYTSYLVAGCDAYNGYYHGWMLNQNVAAINSGGSIAKCSNVPTRIETPIMRVYVNTRIAFNAGDKIRIYGVRA